MASSQFMSDPEAEHPQVTPQLDPMAVAQQQGLLRFDEKVGKAKRKHSSSESSEDEAPPKPEFTLGELHKAGTSGRAFRCFCKNRHISLTIGTYMEKNGNWVKEKGSQSVSLKPDELRDLMDKWDTLVDEIEVVTKAEKRRIKEEKKQRESQYKKPFIKYNAKRGRFY